jgi:SAM-dependent methyltransferase
MKVRDSGMPDEEYWETLFDVPLVLDRLAVPGRRDVAEFGCGYGTFTVPVARAIHGTLWAFDVDQSMVERTQQRAAGLRVVAEVRDVMEQGFGVQAEAVLLFNILHCERPVELLRHAAAALSCGGEALVIHWRHGPTPRGPELDIRPRPEHIIRWAAEAGLGPASEAIDLPPWHLGLRLRRLRPSGDEFVSG